MNAMDSIAIILAAISAIASAFAAAAALAQTRKAGKATEATVYVHMMQQYGSPEMRDAIRNLAELGRTARANNADVESTYASLMTNNPKLATKIRGSSRRLSTYFCDAHRLYEAKFLSKLGLVAVISHPGLNVFYKIAVPINSMKNSNHNSIGASKLLSLIVSKHGEGVF